MDATQEEAPMVELGVNVPNKENKPKDWLFNLLDRAMPRYSRRRQVTIFIAVVFTIIGFIIGIGGYSLGYYVRGSSIIKPTIPEGMPCGIPISYEGRQYYIQPPAINNTLYGLSETTASTSTTPIPTTSTQVNLHGVNETTVSTSTTPIPTTSTQINLNRVSRTADNNTETSSSKNTTKGVEFYDIVKKSDVLYGSTCSFDHDNGNIMLLYRDKAIIDSLYDGLVKARNMNNWEPVISKNSNGILVFKPMPDIVHYDLKSGEKTDRKIANVFFSSKAPERAPLPSSVISSLNLSAHILKPVLSFSDPFSAEPHRIFHMAFETELMYTRSQYPVEDIKDIIRNILKGISLAYNGGYFVENFDNLDVFVAVNFQTGAYEGYFEIIGARIFDNGNFIQSDSLSMLVKENYVKNLKKFLMKMIGELSAFNENSNVDQKFYGIKHDDNGIEVINDKVTPEILDFYFVLGDFLGEKATTIKNIQKHPFITGKRMEKSDYSEWLSVGTNDEKSTVYRKLVNQTID